MKRSTAFIAGAVATVLAALLLTRVVQNEYFFFAGYVVLQFVVLATAWNILGGYAGYVNFGSGAFFAVGAYTAVALIKAFAAPLILQLIVAACATGLMGFAVGAMTLRLRGIFFSIATVAIAVICETVVVNSSFVGGARGIAILQPPAPAWFGSYTRLLFAAMALLAVLAVALARYVQTSWIGRGLRAIRDNEEAAEAVGVPTLKLKLFAATVSGALMGIAGAPFPLYMSFVEPTSVFSLNYAVSALAMPIIGGTASWVGPVIGAVLLGSLQQIVTVTVSSELNVLVVGLLLVTFVVVAPQGILGLVRRVEWSKASSPGATYPAGATQGPPLPGAERTGVRVNDVSIPTPHPDPLPQGERGAAEPPLSRRERAGVRATDVSIQLLRIRDVSKRFGGFTALTDVSLDVGRGERLGIIGPNGSGKTTLINCVCGTLRSDSGSISFDATDVTRLASHQRTRLGMARSFQIPRPFASMTLAENVAVPLEYVTHRRSLHTADVRGEAVAILAQMGLSAMADMPASALTQVDLRKLELARALAARPSLLILDEVMAGLSSAEVDEVLGFVLRLNQQGMTIIMIEHIMRAIMRFSERVVCLDAGRVMAEGSPQHIASDATVRRIYLGG